MLNLPKIYDKIYSSKQNIKYSFFHLLNFLHIKIYVVFILISNFVLWYLAYFINVNTSQELIALHYNVGFGVDLVGNAKKLYIVPTLSLIIFLFNTFLLFNFYKSKHFKFISHILFSACLLVNMFLFLSLASVYLINFIG